MSPTNPHRFGLALLLISALAACQDPEPGANGEAPADTGQTESVEPISGGDDAAEGSAMTEGNLQRMDLNAAVDAALQDLSERRGVSPEGLSVVEARSVTWANGALGCPEEGMMYTQALVKGFYILLGDGERRYAYHAGSDGKPFLCPSKRSQRPPDDDGRAKA